MKMAFSFVTFQRKNFAKKLVQSQLNGLEYDAALLDSDFSILSGCIITCSDEKDVIIMQEGSTDTLPRRCFPRMNAKHILGFLFAKMGFANFAINYKLRDIHNCVKLMSRPDLAVYRDYKEIQPLFLPGQYHSLFLDKLSNLYNSIEWNAINNVDYVLFTSSLKLRFNDPSVYDQMRKWLNTFAVGKKILIKKHPRDEYAYDWSEFDISFIDTSIPAEIFLSQITQPHIIHMFLSTIMMNMPVTQTNYTVLHFNSIKDKFYSEAFSSLSNSLKIPEDHIVSLDP